MYNEAGGSPPPPPLPPPHLASYASYLDQLADVSASARCLFPATDLPAAATTTVVEPTRVVALGSPLLERR